MNRFVGALSVLGLSTVLCCATEPAPAGPGPGATEGQCTLYQKYEFDAHRDRYASCAAVVVPYDSIDPAPDKGHMWIRTVPRCIDGTDGPCAGKELRCIDGTRPQYHVDKALDSSGNPMSSNKWVFFFPGGGSCGRTGAESAAENCGAAYATGAEATEMSTRHANPQFKTVSARESPEGILGADPTSYFSGFNRVKIYKCSYDRYAGNTTNVDVTRGITLYFHGRKIIEAVFRDLARSRGVVSDAGDGDLPSLADATKILVSGNSGGSGGLVMNADWISGLLGGFTSAAVRFALDSRIEPNFEAESHFEDGAGATNLYGRDTDGVSALDNGTTKVSITRSAVGFRAGGDDRLQFDSRGDIASTSEPYLDASCFRTHAADPSPCYDEGHVLVHHMSAHRFMYQSLRDANHRNNPVRWVTSWTQSPAPFAFVPNSPPDLQFGVAFADRVVYAADQFSRFRASSDETPAPPVFDLAIMIPDHPHHVNISDNHYFREASMTRTTGSGPVTLTFASALESWIEKGGDLLIVDDGKTTEKSVGGGWSTAP